MPLFSAAVVGDVHASLPLTCLLVPRDMTNLNEHGHCVRVSLLLPPAGPVQRCESVLVLLIRINFSFIGQKKLSNFCSPLKACTVEWSVAILLGNCHIYSILAQKKLHYFHLPHQHGHHQWSLARVPISCINK